MCIRDSGKAGPTSGLKRSHLGPTSLSWTLSSYQFRLDSLLSSSNFISHHLMIFNFVDLALIWFAADCLCLQPPRAIWSFSSLLSLKIKANYLFGKTNHKSYDSYEKVYSAWHCHICTRMCSKLQTKVQRPEMPLCILYIHLVIQLHKSPDLSLLILWVIADICVA